MPSFSPAPPERPYDEHELDTYAGVGESSRPLLNGSPDPGSLHSASSSTSTAASGRRPARRGSSTTRAVMRRWWKPLVALSTPFLFLMIYSAVHPHVPGLPPLPKVSIHSGYEAPHVPGRLDLIGAEEDVCRCGETDAGQRLCDVYQREGLRLSRAVEVTGARVRRVLQKAREGEKLKVGILGGSGESAGGTCKHGCASGLESTGAERECSPADRSVGVPWSPSVAYFPAGRSARAGVLYLAGWTVAEGHFPGSQSGNH